MSIDIRPFERVVEHKTTDIEGSTLIIPSISIGNVPQLAIDLLIHTYNFVKIGNLDSIYLYPFSSPIDTAPDPEIVERTKGVSGALEVYYNDKLKVSIIQQRSPILPSFTSTYINEVIIPFLAGGKFSEVLILDSSDAGLLEDFQPGKIQVYTNEDLLNNSLGSLNILKKDAIQLSSKYSYDHSVYAGLLIKALDELNLKSESSIDLNVLVAYVYEGDNFQDGEILANKVNSILDLEQITSWIKPLSWLGAYGDKPVPNAMEEGLFG